MFRSALSKASTSAAGLRSVLSRSLDLRPSRAAPSSTSAPSRRSPSSLSRARRDLDWASIRPFSSSPASRHGDIHRPEPGTGIKVTFKEASGKTIKTIEGNEGDDLLSLAHEYDVDLEGACEGSIACSTCHVVLGEEMFETLPEPSDEENDMLDLAFGLTDTSRLGCQVRLSRDVDGLVATLPSATRNMFVDGAKPTKH